MYEAGISFFSTYALFYFIDEVRFHRRRGLSGAEWRWRLFNTALIAGTAAYALFVEYDLAHTLGFYSLVGLSMFAYPFADKDRHAHVGGGERWLHTVLAMMHPAMLLYLGATWRFIDGAGFFMKLVLPFSTRDLRPLCWGYFGVMSFILLWQLVYWPFAFARMRRALRQAAAAVERETALVPSAENEAPAAVPIPMPIVAAATEVVAEIVTVRTVTERVEIVKTGTPAVEPELQRQDDEKKAS